MIEQEILRANDDDDCMISEPVKDVSTPGKRERECLRMIAKQNLLRDSKRKIERARERERERERESVNNFRVKDFLPEKQSNGGANQIVILKQELVNNLDKVELPFITYHNIP